MTNDQPESSQGSTDSAIDGISHWLSKLKQGDDRAPDVIWNEYFARLVRLAERKMMATKRRSLGEEDVALSALKSFIMVLRKASIPIWKIVRICGNC